ncbi:radical SAM/SPASM domain-containing protein [Cellulosilyticum ruminicola]|uniref:radical SAM/SPASM domain-containing protein n=1 Tax=Cellulosilyticum ruminicola TaxID=425254 RepID=UPI0006D00969|nr:radical SAM protein [Cellulosilyticum ruminicola]
MNIHFIEDDSIQLAYFGETARFFAVNLLTKSLILDIDANTPDETLCSRYDLSHDDLQQFKEYLASYNTVSIPTPSLNKLRRLIFNISNTCNLRCKYCYANHGQYGSTENLMTIETAKKALDAFYNHFESIDLLQLFGGEPTLNLPVMKYICEYITEKNKTLSNPTTIGLVTNGVDVSDEFIDLINTYNMTVTVSYDGNPTVNDLIRVFPNNQGSSTRIIENIKKLQKYTTQPDTIEVTYSQYHIEHSIRIIDIMKHIRETFGESIEVHIAPATGDCHCATTLKDFTPFIDSIDDVFHDEVPDNVLYNMLQRPISALVSKKIKNDFICEAGFNTLSVSSDGNIFPCFTFTDHAPLYMGNINDENVFTNEAFLTVQNKFLAFSKSQNEYCKDCFAKRLCNACLGCHLLAANTAFKLNEANCDAERKMAEKIILNLYKLKTAEAN